MGAIFQSLRQTIAAGVVLLIVLLIILAVAAGANVPIGEHSWWAFVMRWLHVMSGVMWIGLLWYFNFVQTPSMPKIPGRAEARNQQGDRADGPVLVPLGGAWRPSSPA